MDNTQFSVIVCLPRECSQLVLITPQIVYFTFPQAEMSRQREQEIQAMHLQQNELTQKMLERERAQQERSAAQAEQRLRKAEARNRSHSPRTASPRAERSHTKKAVAPHVTGNAVGRDASLAKGRNPAMIGAKGNLANGRSAALANGNYFV